MFELGSCPIYNGRAAHMCARCMCYQLQLISPDSIKLPYFVNCFLIVCLDGKQIGSLKLCLQPLPIDNRSSRTARNNSSLRQPVSFRLILLMIYSAERFSSKSPFLLAFAANEIFFGFDAPHPLARLRTMPANINFPSGGLDTHAEAIYSDKCPGTPFHHR